MLAKRICAALISVFASESKYRIIQIGKLFCTKFLWSKIAALLKFAALFGVTPRPCLRPALYLLLVLMKFYLRFFHFRFHCSLLTVCFVMFSASIMGNEDSQYSLWVSLYFAMVAPSTDREDFLQDNSQHT